jgi:hypothetical protein
MATILCDSIEIVGNAPRAVNQTSPGSEVRLPCFNTGGRVSNHTALLLFSARNLEGGAQVFINNHLVGGIAATPGSVFSTQLIAVSGSKLNDGKNEIVLRSVTDPFEIKDLICLFHQTEWNSSRSSGLLLQTECSDTMASLRRTPQHTLSYPGSVESPGGTGPEDGGRN